MSTKALTRPTARTLSTLTHQARQYASRAQAEHTTAAYRGQWARFEQWCKANGRQSLPAEPGTVADYLAGLAAAGRKFATVAQARAAIRKAHLLAGLAEPTGAPAVLAVVGGIGRTIGTAPAQKAPLSVDDLRALVAACPATLAGARDRALLLVGFWGAFRRSELVALDVEDVHLNGALKITLRFSKTDQLGEGQHKTLPALNDETLCPVHALKAWLDAADIQSGAIFRGVDRWGHLRGGRLTDKQVVRVVKACAERAGLDARRLAGHSLRAGFVTAALDAGAQTIDIREVTGHKTDNMLSRYARRAGRGGVRAIKLMAGEVVK